MSFFFSFNNTAPTDIYTLSLHDALPICNSLPTTGLMFYEAVRPFQIIARARNAGAERSAVVRRLSRSENRSEEHTSELQSRQYLVCRLLLEKKKKTAKTRKRERQTKPTS